MRCGGRSDRHPAGSSLASSASTSTVRLPSQAPGLGAQCELGGRGGGPTSEPDRTLRRFGQVSWGCPDAGRRGPWRAFRFGRSMEDDPSDRRLRRPRRRRARRPPHHPPRRPRPPLPQPPRLLRGHIMAGGTAGRALTDTLHGRHQVSGGVPGLVVPEGLVPGDRVDRVRGARDRHPSPPSNADHT